MLKIKEVKPKIGFIGSDRQSILKDLNFAIKNGFDCYEIQAVKEPKGEVDFNLKPVIINQVKKISKENNIFLSLHISHFVSLCSANHEISKEALEFAKKEVILAKEVGAKQITIHGGTKDTQNNENTVAKNFEILIKNLKEIIKLSKEFRIKIGLENAFDPSRLCRKPEDLLKVVNSVNPVRKGKGSGLYTTSRPSQGAGLSNGVKGLGITFDIGHANVINFDPIEYFRKVKKFVINMHLHDNDSITDQHVLFGEGNIDFKTLLRECKNSNYYGPFIFEVFPHENVLKAKEIFLNLWNQI
ncbi:MAG: sugar phosphate isomerase/epimerase [Candidatus Nealsonbacteria bacterium]|nr:sugar phosphate isomerase/epimerase [Candidatus Nealsonbacteria bacterium]